MNRTIIMTAVGSAFAMAACSDTRPATPEEADDVAQAIGVTLAAGDRVGDIASMTDSVDMAFGRVPFGFSRMGNGEIRGRRFNLEFSFTVTCNDAAGTPLERCGRTTDDATIDVAWSGSIDTRSFDSTVNRIGTWTLTDLQSEIATLSGLSAFSLETTLNPIRRPEVTSTYELDLAAAYDAIRIDVESRTPIGGVAFFDVSAHRVVTGTDHDVDASFDLDAVLTFHDDHTASLVIDGTRHYLIDLDTGRIIRVDPASDP